MFQRIIKSSSQVADLMNSQEKVDQKTRNVLLPDGMRASLVEVARLAAERKLVVGKFSEISVRSTGDRMAISAFGAWFAHAAEDDFTVVAISNGRPLLEKPAPPLHADWHRAVYQSTPAGAVFLSQPPAAFRVASGKPFALDAGLLPDGPQLVGEVTWCQPDDQTIAVAAQKSQALLLPGYGLLVWAEKIFEALSLAESVDFWLQTHLF